MPLLPTEYISRYISSGIFFDAHFPSVKPSVMFFFLIDLAMERGITDERHPDGRFL